MERVSPKEKTVIIVCIFITIVMLVTRIYGFIFAQNSLADLLGTIGVSLIFLGVAFSPKIFFTPVKQVLTKSYVLPTFINPKCHQAIIITGCLLSAIPVLWQILY